MTILCFVLICFCFVLFCFFVLFCSVFVLFCFVFCFCFLCLFVCLFVFFLNVMSAFLDWFCFSPQIDWYLTYLYVLSSPQAEPWKLNTYPSSNKAILCNTSNQGGGGCCNLPRFSEPNPLWNWFLYQKVGMEFLYSYIPKSVKSAKALRSYDVIKNMPDLKIAIFCEK